MVDAKDKHVFLATGVERAEPMDGAVCVKLSDARGGQVTLRMDPAVAAQLRALLQTSQSGAS